MDQLTSINHNLVTSLTHRNTRKISLTPDGTIRSTTYYDPQHGEYTAAELAEMQRNVVASARVFGLLVSPDMKAAIIKGTLNEGALDYGKIFAELQAIRDEGGRAGRAGSTQPAIPCWSAGWIPTARRSCRSSSTPSSSCSAS